MMTRGRQSCLPGSGNRTTQLAQADQANADAASIARIHRGDTSGYEPLWNSYWPKLFKFFVLNLHSREEAEDQASATLLAAFEQLPSFRGSYYLRVENEQDAVSPIKKLVRDKESCTFQHYLFSIAHNKLARSVRRRYSRPCSSFTEIENIYEIENAETPFSTIGGSDYTDNPLATIMRREYLDDVLHALAYVQSRSKEQYEVLKLHYVDDLPHKEVAHRLGIRSETVNTRLQEGRRKMLRYCTKC